MKLKVEKFNTTSNYISILRVLLGIPIFIYLDKLQDAYDYRIILFSLCLFAAVTDLLDGYFARKYNEVTEFGKIIDPLADKLLMAIIVIKLYLIGEIPAFYFWIVILRDVIIFAGGIFVSNKIGKVLPSNLLGKITIISIGLFVLGIILNVRTINWLYQFLMYLSLLLSIASIFGYAIRGIESVRWYKKNETA